MSALQGASLWLLIGGAVLLILGVLVRRLISGWDLTGVATDSAWQVARGRRSAAGPTALEAKLREVAGDRTAIGTGRRAAGVAVRHVLAQVLGTLSLIVILAGLALIAGGLLWK